jgi:hypothetical protein
MRLGPLLLSTVLVALTVAPAATADKPTREIIAAPEDMVISDQCAFPVLANIDGVEIDTTFTDKAGNPVKLLGVFPGNTLTLTNLATGNSITLVTPAVFHARAEADGSTSFSVTGSGPSLGNPITGEPGIWYSSGRLSATVDAEGNLTSLEATGRLVDLCRRLAF